MMRLSTLSLTLITALALTACAQSPMAPATAAKAAPAAKAATPTVLDVAAKDPQLSTFVQLAKDAGLADTLNSAGSYTVFAPSNDAFKAVPAKTLDGLAADKAALKNVLSYHVLSAKLAAADVKPGKAKTVQGSDVTLGATAGFATVEDALVTQADLAGTNGVVHVVDRVLMPPKK
jgi:uncharacterized surface protein with fasciclin (FAS1) repeats